MKGNRAVSVAITHALTVAISAILISGLIVGAGTLLESQEQSVGEEQLEEIGSDAVSYIHTFDRMNGTGEDVTMSATPDYPDRIVGSYRYTLQLHDDRLEVRADSLDRSAEFPIETENTNLSSSSTSGTDVEIALCADGTITLGGCQP